MNLENTITLIENFQVNDEMEDYEISEFFDAIGFQLEAINRFTDSQKQQLIQTLFDFLKRQDPELDEVFSFIHLIEAIDQPDYKIYNVELLKFNTENGTITSTFLLNRCINGLKKEEREKYVNLLKSIANNTQYTDLVRAEALGYYKHQIV
ncbi:hypothetical protein [Winogradskyella vidalii]|uniref:hypothetical protein n=1 Tax=Winogradskyella vidalii TaxID=2615024 RepID=UPI0015CBA68F|nr:hypothetical protein [Winogradskyella vidalii]